MSDLKDIYYDDREKRLVEHIKDVFKSLLSKEVNPLSKELGKVSGKLEHVYQSLRAKGLVEPYMQSSSPKKITERGYKLLKANDVEDYLNDKCKLLTEDFKDKSDAQIFIECSDWIKKDGKEKVAEVMLNSNIPEQDCIMLLALFIMEKIKKKQS